MRWNIRDIAEHLRLSVTYVRNTVVHRPDFPRPVVQTSRKHRLWAAEDVRKWAGA